MIDRAYQDIFTQGIADAFASGARRVLAVLPTGGGKTNVFTKIARQSRGRLAIVAHRRELIRQASNRLGAPHGVIAPGYPATDDPLQVGSIQTMARRLDRLPEFHGLIFDEAHRAVAGQWRSLLDRFPLAQVLGVTATPERLDGRGIGEVFDMLVVGPSVAEGVAGGWLCPAVVYAPDTSPDLTGARTVAGDYVAAELLEVMGKSGLIGDAVEHYRRLCPGESAIVSCVNVAHAEQVAALFRADGWRAVSIHGKTPEAERDAALAGLETGAVQLVCFCDLIDEGVDVPGVSCVIMLRPTQSLGKFMQIVGRGFRPAPGKTRLIVLDHAGNVLRHGMPDSPREWSLDGRPKKAKPPAVTHCPACLAVHHPGPTCPHCGYVYPVVVLPERRTLTVVDGRLVELAGGDDPRISLAELLKAARDYDDVDKIRSIRGYKPGWTHAAMKYHRVGGRPRESTTAAQDFAA